MIEHSAFAGLERALLDHAAQFYSDGSKQMGKLSQESKGDRVTRIVERYNEETALLHLDGVIDKHISEFEMVCYGGYDLRDFDNALKALAAAPEIQNIMLVVNSPGGSVTGVPESAALVREVAKSKNVFAFTDGMMASAAYYIASQADQVFGSPSSDVGSIGVYVALLDATKMLDKKGVTVNFIKDGKYKGMGAPFKPLTNDERAMFQEQVDHIGAMFRDAVTSNRSQVSIDTMQGQCFFGAAAEGAGLVDATLPGLDAAIAQF